MHNIVALGKDDDFVARNVELQGGALTNRRLNEWILVAPTCLINFPIILSESPFEYMLAVSMVLTPRSQAALSKGIA